MIYLTLSVRRKLVTDLRKHRPNVLRVLFPSFEHSLEHKIPQMQNKNAFSASTNVALRVISSRSR